MANDYVNKITLENGTVYDIHDQRVDNLSGGTKLYEHFISGDEDIVIISADSTPIGSNTSKSYSIGQNRVISMFLFSMNTLITDLFYSSNSWKVTKIDGTQESIGSIGTITDTVTEL